MMKRHNVSTWIGYEPPPFEDMLELASSCHIYLKFVNLDVQIREASARIPKGISYLTDISKKSKDKLRDPVLQVTMRDHATYPSSFLTYHYFGGASPTWKSHPRSR